MQPQLLRPQLLGRKLRPQILEPQSSIWGLNFNSSYANVANSDNFNITGDLSIIAGIKPASIHGGQIFSKRDNNTYHAPYFLLLDGAPLRFSLGEGGSSECKAQGGSYSAGERFQIAGTIIGNDAKVYKNGTVVGTDTFSGTRQTNAVQARIGTGAGPLGFYFNGIIYYLYVYSRGLSQAEVTLYAENPKVFPDMRDLVAGFRLQEGFGTANGTQLGECSGNNNYATMQNFASNAWVNIGVM